MQKQQHNKNNYYQHLLSENIDMFQDPKAWKL